VVSFIVKSNEGLKLLSQACRGMVTDFSYRSIVVQERRMYDVRSTM